MNEKELLISKAYHRIIMPVFIPNLEGYYNKSFEVLKLCCTSLFQSIHNETNVTIINNNSCKSVTHYLRRQLEEKKIDQLIEFKENKGKVDPVIAVMRSCHEKLITLTDCDVLFKTGWQSAVEDVFSNISHTGMVSPLPIPSLNKYYSAWSWYTGIIKRCIFKLKGIDEEAISFFLASIGQYRHLTENEKNPCAIEINGCKAIIGAGHFCATFNKNIINYIPNRPSGNKFKGAEELFLDKPVQDGGFLRLATYKGWVYHMGNSVEPWMNDIIYTNQKKIEHTQIINLDFGFRYNSFVSYLIIRLFSSDRILKYFKIKYNDKRTSTTTVEL